MGWGEWCVPTLSESQQFEIEKYKRIMHNLATSDPTRLAGVASDLARQNIQLQVIVQKATGRIAELEAREALAEDPRRRWRMNPVRWAWRWVVDQIVSKLPWQHSAA